MFFSSVQTAPKDAKSPADFTAIPETVITFGPNENSKVVIIDIINDKEPEKDEEFEVKLKSNDAGIVAVSPDTATIKILDDDSKCFKCLTLIVIFLFLFNISLLLVRVFWWLSSLYF